MKERIIIGKEAKDKLNAWRCDHDLKSYDEAIHQLFTELEQTIAELEAELEASVQADEYLVRTYGKLTQKDVDMLQQAIDTAYTNTGWKSCHTKAEWRELGKRFGLDLTD